jgi:hypothetical protein
MASYTVYFIFECSPETHWGEETDEEIVLDGERHYQDGEESFDEEGEVSTIKSWEDAVDDITARWEGDSLSEYDYIDLDKKNHNDNGKSEFEDGTGDVNFETIKVEIYEDNEWKNLVETKNL